MTPTAAKIQGVQVKDPARWNAGVVASKDGESLTQSQDIPEGFCQCGCGEKTPLASQTDARRGWIKGEPVRFAVGSHARRKSAVEYVSEDRGHVTPCWVWQRSINDSGYGVASRAGRTRSAHRLYYEDFVGEIPKGMQLDHLCRVRNCVNPDHLEPVTQTENARRGVATKLTTAQVAEIKARAAEPHDALALEFGVTESGIRNITNGHCWKDVEPFTTTSEGGE